MATPADVLTLIGDAASKATAGLNGVADVLTKVAAAPLKLASAVSPISAFAGGLEKVKDVSDAAFGGLQRLTGAIQSTVASYTQLYNPAATRLLQFAIDDLNAAIGQALMPVLRIATDAVRTIGNVIAAASPATKSLVAALALASIASVAVASGVAVMTAAMAALSAAINSATFGLPVLIGAVASVVAAFVAGSVALAAVGKPVAEFKKVFQDLANGFEKALDVLGAGFQKVAKAAEPLLALFVKLANAGVGELPRLVDGFTDALARIMAAIAPTIELILPPLVALHGALLDFNVLLVQIAAAALKPFLDACRLVLDPLAKIVYVLATVIDIGTRFSRFFLETFQGVFDALDAPLKYLKGLFTEIVGPPLAKLNKAFSDLKATFGDAFTAIRQIVLGIAKNLLEPLRPVAEFIQRVVITAFQLLGKAIEGVVSYIQFVIDTIKILFDIKPEKDRVNPNASVGLSVKQSQIGSVESFIDRARTAAFSAGRGNETPEKKNESNIQSLAENMKALKDDVKAIKKFVTTYTGAAGNVAGGVGDAAKAAIAPTLGFPAMALRQFMNYQG